MKITDFTQKEVNYPPESIPSLPLIPLIHFVEGGYVKEYGLPYQRFLGLCQKCGEFAERELLVLGKRRLLVCYLCKDHYEGRVRIPPSITFMTIKKMEVNV